VIVTEVVWSSGRRNITRMSMPRGAERRECKGGIKMRATWTRGGALLRKEMGGSIEAAKKRGARGMREE